MTLLDGQVAVVTGAAQGIGLAITELFAENGATVVMADLNGLLVEAESARLNGRGYRTVPMKCDVADESNVASLFDRTSADFGRLDVMVNNAGITRDATLRKMTLDDFTVVLRVHLQGTWLGTRAAAAVMRDQGAGSIINMSSIAAKVGNVGQTNYSAAKAGIIGLTKAAAKELAHVGVRVNAIQPGLIRTSMTEAMKGDVWQRKLAEIPMNRAGEPEDVAKAALFFASDLSSYLTGTVLEVAGGRFM